MSRGRSCACLLAAALAVTVIDATASPLAQPLVATPADLTGGRWPSDGAPQLVLAQRAIEREWSVVGDSGRAGLHREGMKSEVGAAALSAAIPGSGQLYAGRRSGYAFAAAEVAGWVGYLLLRGSGHDLRDDAQTLVGAPEDSASAWSFDRWETRGGDATELRVLYAADREAFYDAIDSDPRYADGWSSAGTRQEFADLRERSRRRLGQARWTGAALWVNHLVAAVDALRAARLGNLDLTLAGDVALKARGSWQGGGPGVVVTLERRF